MDVEYAGVLLLRIETVRLECPSLHLMDVEDRVSLGIGDISVLEELCVEGGHGYGFTVLHPVDLLKLHVLHAYDVQIISHEGDVIDGASVCGDALEVLSVEPDEKSPCLLCGQEVHISAVLER